MMELKKFEKRVYLSSPTMHQESFDYMKEAYDTNWMSTIGENINEIEKQMSEKVGCKYAVALSCGTSALHMAVKLAGVAPKDKVFCSDMTFAATVNPVVYEKAEPVFTAFSVENSPLTTLPDLAAIPIIDKTLSINLTHLPIKILIYLVRYYNLQGTLNTFCFSGFFQTFSICTNISTSAIFLSCRIKYYLTFRCFYDSN